MRIAIVLLLGWGVGCGESTLGGESEGEDDGGSPARCGEPVEQEGEGTYYAADGSGSCSFDPSPDDLMVAAMNDADYAGAATCGACARVVGPDGAVTVRIVDRCPECAPGDIDLSREAFGMIAAIEAGRVPISWSLVPCEVEGPLRYRFKEGSSQWWTAVQVRNHRHAIETLEVSVDGGATFSALARESYNYFVDADGFGSEPVDLRVTDVHGHVVREGGLEVGDGTIVEGGAQLPACD